MFGGIPIWANLLASDLRTRYRSKSFAVMLAVAVLMPALVTLAFLWRQVPLATGDSSNLGIQLFQALASLELLLLAIFIPMTTGAGISGERQRNRWDLLLSSRLSSLDIALAKLLSGLATALLIGLLALPFFSISLLFGSISSSDVVAAGAVLLASAVLFSSIGLLVSSLGNRSWLTSLAAVLAVVGLIAGISLFAAYDLQQQQQPAFVASFLPPPKLELTPLAEIDPFVALLSALPAGNGQSVLGSLGSVNHPLGLSLNGIQVWTVYFWLTLSLSLAIFSVTVPLLRHPLRFPRRFRSRSLKSAASA